MNVAISDIAHDLGTDVIGVQTTITLFTLVMASLMIPGSKLTDIWGRKRCFLVGLVVYGAGALLASVAPRLGVMIVGYSVMEGVGSALMIPPIYILVTVAFTDLRERAKYFGIVSGAGGLGAAAGPLIGGLITSAFTWRASFLTQVLLVVLILVLGRRIVEPPRREAPPRFDVTGAVISAAGLFFVVLGILLSGSYGWFAARKELRIGELVLVREGGVSPVWPSVVLGGVFLLWFFLHIRSVEVRGGEPLLHTRLFRSRTANAGLGTQAAQWLIMQGTFFTTSVFLQEVRGYSAIETGLMLTPAIVGVLVSSAAAGRLAGRRTQRSLIIAGFGTTAVGMVLQLLLVRADSGVLSSVPGLLLTGLGIGVMLTSSVTVVQSSFPDRDQGDISGLSRSVSNLGSSLGTALVGSILVAFPYPGGRPFALATVALLVAAVLGLVLALMVRGPDPGR